MARFGSARFTNVQSGPEINDRPSPLPRARAGGSLVAFAASAVLLLLLLIFILQNDQRANVHFLGAQGQLPVGVALLLAAVFGVLLVTTHGITRRIQLRLSTRRNHPPNTTARPDPGHPGPRAEAPEGRNP
ncbi:LapA family protein [Micromonospora musae]|uniref:LapA family protein n=1 Tax=Micromonospora musae TaxID=1894970 RepID=UPI0033FE54BE